VRGLFKNIWTPVIGKRLKENSKTSLVWSSSDSSKRCVVHEFLLEPKVHTHQVTARCATTFARAKSRNDLILANLNLVVGWSIRQTSKFNSPPNFPPIRYLVYESKVRCYKIPCGVPNACIVWISLKTSALASLLMLDFSSTYTQCSIYT
jgi:hypothetical protein